MRANLYSSLRLTGIIILCIFVSGWYRGDHGWFEPVCGKAPVVVWYDVEGKTVEEILQSLLKNGPRDKSGVARFANTQWHVIWKWPLNQNNKPDFRNTTLECTSSIALPRWKQPEDANPEVVKLWQNFFSKTVAHERNHLSHVRLLAPRIPELIKSRSLSDQEMTAEQANKIGSSILSEMQLLDREYDESTGHGKTEGITGEGLLSQNSLTFAE